MDRRIAKHEKIRFRRHEIANLAALPSAQEQPQHWQPRGLKRRSIRLCMGAAGVAAAVVGLLAAVVLLAVVSGWGTERLRVAAERAVTQLAGFPVTASIGQSRLTLDGSSLIAIELQDVAIANDRTRGPMLKAGSLRFGIRLVPLLTGSVRLGSATIADARIDLGSLPTAQGTDWTIPLRDESGLISPDKVSTALFEQVRGLMNAVEDGSGRSLTLKDVRLLVPEGNRVRLIRIDEAALSETKADTVAIDATAEIDGRTLTAQGSATRDPASRRVTGLDVKIRGEPVEVDPDQPPSKSLSQLGGFTASLTGSEGSGGTASVVKVAAALEKSVLDLGARGAFAGNLFVDLSLVGGSSKVEVERLRIETGRNMLEFNGAFGPRPATGREDDRPAYRYELVSTKTIVAPEHSSEPPLEFSMRLAGTLDQPARVLTADEIAISTGRNGGAQGTGRVDLVPGKTPGIEFSIQAQDMQVAHLKQLWPWFAAGKARSWAYEHVFGGRVTQCRIDFHVPPDRLGDGVPLTAEEVSAHFDVDGTRFDTAGLIPPVRDTSFEIAVSSGTVFMPSGRSADLSNAILSVVKANVPPVIGKLEMDVVGSADAIAELASYEPINGLNRVGLQPADFTGKVTGHVTADIPFQKTDLSTLQWLVALDYAGLSLAKPFAGQKISDAQGTIAIQPDRALIKAKAKLNGVPADIDVVEPLRAGGPERQRRIQLVLDDQARSALLPGLAGLVTGAIKVGYEGGDGPRRITADLTGARLDLPWAGWSKGAGVPAKASFAMDTSGDNTTTLSDFSLSGDTFSVDGTITLAGGALSSARLDSVRLNRGDSVTVAIRRLSNGYVVDIGGDALDARPLIKRFTAPGGGGASAGGGKPAYVSLRLDVGRLSGFNDEALSGVKLAYDGTGASIAGLTLSGATASGSKVLVGNADGGIQLKAGDAGAVLRFLDIYRHMQGGTIGLALTGGGADMSGQIDARNFWIVNEPKLASIVSTTPPGGQRSLNDAVRKDIDTSKVQFERGFAQIEKGVGSLRVVNGVLRGPLIGTTFQGTLYDADGRMDMTGTFMPAYGLNRIFGELPLIGAILGNGRDRGLIGVTYKLSGDAKAPRLDINPLSVMAPGIFRSIFEFQ